MRRSLLSALRSLDPLNGREFQEKANFLTETVNFKLKFCYFPKGAATFDYRCLFEEPT